MESNNNKKNAIQFFEQYKAFTPRQEASIRKHYSGSNTI